MTTQKYEIWIGEIISNLPENWRKTDFETWNEVLKAGWKFQGMANEKTIIMTNGGYINGFQMRKEATR